MGVYTKFDVINAFDGSIRERTALPNGLREMWFDSAVGDLSLEIGDIYCDPDTGIIENASRATVNALACLMKVSYCEREVSRVNKINNIITKDVQLNGSGDAKRFAAAELQDAKDRASNIINKMKRSFFEN